jgi:hypothetical protein
VTVRKRSGTASLLAGIVIILAGLGVGVVEALRLPRGTLWIVVVGAVALIALIRRVAR